MILHTFSSKSVVLIQEIFINSNTHHPAPLFKKEDPLKGNFLLLINQNKDMFVCRETTRHHQHGLEAD